MTFHQQAKPGDILISDAPTLIGKIIMAGTDSECGHVGFVYDTKPDGTALVHEALRQGVIKTERPLGTKHVGYITITNDPAELALMRKVSDQIVIINEGYGWGEIIRIGIWSIASWMKVLHLGWLAKPFTTLTEYVAAKVENPHRRICSNHTSSIVLALWEYRAQQGDQIAQYMLDSNEYPPERQWPGYLSKRIRLSLRLYQQQGIQF